MEYSAFCSEKEMFLALRRPRGVLHGIRGVMPSGPYSRPPPEPRAVPDSKLGPASRPCGGLWGQTAVSIVIMMRMAIVYITLSMLVTMIKWAMAMVMHDDREDNHDFGQSRPWVCWVLDDRDTAPGFTTRFRKKLSGRRWAKTSF